MWKVEEAGSDKAAMLARGKDGRSSNWLVVESRCRPSTVSCGAGYSNMLPRLSMVLKEIVLLKICEKIGENTPIRE
jgi:hypothetical protein